MAANQELVPIENVVGVEQSVFYNKKRYVIAPFAAEAVPRELADAFLSQRGKYIRYHEDNAMPAGRPGEEIMYVANMTGDPYAPDEVELVRVRKNEEETYRIPNPIKLARRLTTYVGLGEKIGTAEDGGITISPQPKQPVILQPFRRYPMPASVADLLMHRDGLREFQHRGQIKLVSPPTIWEANETWTLDELWTFGMMMDTESFKKLRTDGRVKFEFEYGADTVGLGVAKGLLWRYVFFRLVDDRYPKPVKEEFDEVWKNTLSERGPADNAGRSVRK